MPGVIVGGPPGHLRVAVAGIVVVVYLHLDAERVASGRANADLRQRQLHLEHVAARHSSDHPDRACRNRRRVRALDHHIAIIPADGQLEVVDAVVAGSAVAVVTIDEYLDAIIVVPAGAAVVDQRLVADLHQQVEIAVVVERPPGCRQVAGWHGRSDGHIGNAVLDCARPDWIYDTIDRRH